MPDDSPASPGLHILIRQAAHLSLAEIIHLQAWCKEQITERREKEIQRLIDEFQRRGAELGVDLKGIRTTRKPKLAADQPPPKTLPAPAPASVPAIDDPGAAVRKLGEKRRERVARIQTDMIAYLREHEGRALRSEMTKAVFHTTSPNGTQTTITGLALYELEQSKIVIALRRLGNNTLYGLSEMVEETESPV
jgi:hypothetical protein